MQTLSYVQSEEGLVEEGDIAFQVLLRLLEDPFLKVYEVESMRIVYLFCLQPLDEERKMVGNLLPVENTVYHVATEKSHFYFVSCVWVDLSVLMN